MFDQIRVAVLALSGKLKGEPVLRKYFWAFVAANGFAMLILAYNAFMSLNYYRQLLERFSPVQSDVLPEIVTVAVALVAYFLIASITGTLLDYWAGREHKTRGHEPMFAAVCLALAGILFLDVYANLKGVDYVSISTTQAIAPNPLRNITTAHDTRGNEAAARYEAEIGAVRAKLERLEKFIGDTGHNCARVGCEKGKYKGRTGSPHWQGVLTPYGQALATHYNARIDELRAEKAAELASIRGDKERELTAAQDDYDREKTRFDATVNDKQTGHTNLVWFAYGLAFLLCLFTNHYADKALEHVGHPSARASTSSGGRPASVGFATAQQNGDAFEAIQRQLDELARRMDNSGTPTASAAARAPIGFTHGYRAYPATPVYEVTPDGTDGGGTVTVHTHTTGYKITCEHCNEPAVMRSPRAKYCGEDCRKAAYEARTGNKLRV